MQNTCNQNGIQLATAQQRWELLAQQSNTEQQRCKTLQQTVRQKETEQQQLVQKQQQYQQEIAENQQLVQQEQTELSRQNQQVLAYKESRQQTQEQIGALEEMCIRDRYKGVIQNNELLLIAL